VNAGEVKLKPLNGCRKRREKKGGVKQGAKYMDIGGNEIRQQQEEHKPEELEVTV